MSDDPMVEKYIFNLERERDTLRARVSELETENKRKIEQLATQVSHVMDLEAENKRLQDALETIPFSVYGDALRDGCDPAGAWDCFREEASRHIKQALEGSGE